MKQLSTCLAVLVLASAPAQAVERLVAALDSPRPELDPRQSVLLIYRPQVMLVPSCDPLDGGVADAAADDGGCRMRTADLVTMVLEPRFKTGPTGSHFVLLTATPSKPLVSLAPPTLFLQLENITAPEVVYDDHYYDDPALGTHCAPGTPTEQAPAPPPPPPPPPPPSSSGSSSTGSVTPTGSTSAGCSAPTGPSKPPPAYTPPTPAALTDPQPILPEGDPLDFSLPPAPYEASVLSVTSPADLQAWLDAQGYTHDPADVDALAPYIALGWYVVAVRLEADHEFSGERLASIALTFEASMMRLPLGIARQSMSGTEPMTVYIAGDTRYEIGADDKVAWAHRSEAIGGASFLTRNEDQFAIDAPPEADPIAMSKSAISLVPTVTVVRNFHYGSQCEKAGSSCVIDGGSPFSAPSWLLMIPVIALIARRRRRAG